MDPQETDRRKLRAPDEACKRNGAWSGQEDVFENVDFCLKGLLRRHGRATERMPKTTPIPVANESESDLQDLQSLQDHAQHREECQGRILRPLRQ